VPFDGPGGQEQLGAEVIIYPDSAHGFLFQHHAEFAADVEAFLTGAS
jgi:pimeloyl-ACP methyl ester carboxylesterase